MQRKQEILDEIEWCERELNNPNSIHAYDYASAQSVSSRQGALKWVLQPKDYLENSDSYKWVDGKGYVKEREKSQ